MPRIRTIKPTAFSSESLANVSVEARWTFAGLWTYVDDEGRGKADPRLIKAHVWPLDDAVSAKRVETLLAELEREQMIRRYRVGGRLFLVVVNWAEHQYIQRPKASQLPSPDESCAEQANENDGSVIDHGRVTDESRQERKGREGNRDTATRGAVAPALIPHPEDDGRTDSAGVIVAEWMDRCAERPPNSVIGQTAKSIRQMLSEGIAAEHIRNGMREWEAKGLHPSALPSVVNQVMNARPAAARRSTTDDRVLATLALAERFEAADSSRELTDGRNAS